MAKKKIIVGVSASIACYKACDIVRRLKEAGLDVAVVMTEEAKEFIRPQVFASLSGNRVYSGMFAEPEERGIEHVSLAESAGCILIAPATANIINKVACGICDDLLTCVIMATKAPVVFAPAMNSNMYENKITQANIAKLKSLGYKFVGPVKGKLANGKIGAGHLAALDDIIKEAEKVL